MSKTLQVSCVQLHWAKDIERNLASTLRYIEQAALEGSRVVLFPETNLTGYYYPDVLKLSPERVNQALAQTCAAAKQARIWVIAERFATHRTVS
jgi:predicted amidohydrolase